MQQVIAYYQQWLTIGCLAALLACALGFALYVMRDNVTAVMRWVRTHPFQSCLLVPCVCVAVLYGGSKPDPLTPTVKGITLGSPMEIPTQVSLEWQPDEGTRIATNQRVRVYWRDAYSTNWNKAVDGYGITNAVVSGFFVNRDTDWQVIVSPTNAVEEVEP